MWRSSSVFLERSPVSFAPAWRLSDLALGVFGLLLALLVVIALLAAAGGTGGGGGDARGVAATVGVNVAMVGIVLWLARRRGIGLHELGLRRPARWTPVPVAWMGAYVVLGLYAALLLLLEELGLDVSALDQGNPIPVGADAGPAVIVLLAVALVVAAPFGEEFFFRGLLYGGLRGHARLLPALALSGLLFGLFHLNLSVLVPFTAVGMLFAWAVERSESLWSSITAHAAFNSLALGLHLAGAAP